MIKIVSTRFTNKTLSENRDYRSKHGIPCIYGSPQEFSPKILYNTLIMVVEMNNELNQIEGIGLIYNHPNMEKYYNIYSDGNYNRYIYKSNYFIDRDILVRYNPKIVSIFDYILFKEKTHLKRGTGFTTIPEKLLHHKVCETMDILNELKYLFKSQYSKNMDEIEREKQTEIEGQQIQGQQIQEKQEQIIM
jgi:hypothetical protein